MEIKNYKAVLGIRHDPRMLNISGFRPGVVGRRRGEKGEERRITYTHVQTHTHTCTNTYTRTACMRRETEERE